MNDVPTLHSGAGDGNRTRTICLEGRGSTIELHPRGRSYLTGSGRMVITSRSGRWRVVPGCPETLYTRIPRMQRSHARHRDVAPGGSSSALGAEGRRFKSCHPDHAVPPLTCKDAVRLYGACTIRAIGQRGRSNSRNLDTGRADKITASSSTFSCPDQGPGIVLNRPRGTREAVR